LRMPNNEHATNLFDIILGQLRSSIPRPIRASAPLRRVPHVILLGSLNKMGRVAARAIVTRMANHRLREVPVGQKERNAMRLDSVLVTRPPHLPVSTLVRGRLPLPAIISATSQNLGPKPVHIFSRKPS